MQTSVTGAKDTAEGLLQTHLFRLRVLMADAHGIAKALPNPSWIRQLPHHPFSSQAKLDSTEGQWGGKNLVKAKQEGAAPTSDLLGAIKLGGN